MIDSVPLIQNASDAQQINASIIAMKKASRELDEKIVKLNSLNSELDKKIALLDSGLNKEIEDRKEAIKSLDVASVGGSGKYISAISETDGKISATASDITSTVSSGNSQPVTSGGVADAIDKINYSASGRNIDTLYPSENGKSEVFGGNFSGNVPESKQTAILKTFRVSSATSSEVQIYQEWEAYGSSSSSYAPNKYIRFGYFSGSASPTWSPWQKIIRNLDVADTVENNNMNPITSNAVAQHLQRFTGYYKYSPDYTKYILMADVTTWYNSTSSSQFQNVAFLGMLVRYRNGGFQANSTCIINLSVGWYRDNKQLPNSGVMNVAKTEISQSPIYSLCIINYQNKIYLAIRLDTIQAGYNYFYGFASQSPLLTTLSNSETVTEIYVV